MVGGAVVGGAVVGGAVVGGAELLVAGAEGDLLFDGADCVGVGDRRPLGVGPAEVLATGVFDAIPRLVPRPPPSVVLTGTVALAGEESALAD